MAPQLLEFGDRQAAMKQAAKLIAMVTILASGIPQTVVALQADKSEAKKTEQKKKPEGASLIPRRSSPSATSST